MPPMAAWISLGIGAVLYHLAANLQPDLGDHPQDISLSRVAGRPHDEVRGGQGIEMSDMGVDHMGAIEKLPQLLGCRRRVNMVDSVCGLTRGHVMCPRSDTADSGTIRGISSTGLPSQNFSKPRSSGI